MTFASTLSKLLSILGVGLALTGPGQTQTRTLRVGDNVPSTSVQALALDKFAELVNAKNAGVEIKVFHNSQLGPSPLQVQNVKLGVQDMALGGITFLESFSADLRIAETPFSFSSREHFENWFRSPQFQTILTEVVKNGNQRFLNTNVIWKRGPFRVLVAKKPVLNLDEFKNMKLRLWESEVANRFYGKPGLGATSVNIPLGDVYLSIRQGLVDGLTLPFDLLLSMNLQEVAPHIMLIDEFWQALPITINEDKWKGLTPGQQKVIVDAVDAAGAWYNDQVAASVDKWKAALVAAGATFHEVNRAPFVERIRERNKQWQKDGYWRAGLIDEIEAIRAN